MHPRFYCFSDVDLMAIKLNAEFFISFLFISFLISTTDDN